MCPAHCAVTSHQRPDIEGQYALNMVLAACIYVYVFFFGQSRRCHGVRALDVWKPSAVPRILGILCRSEAMKLRRFFNIRLSRCLLLSPLTPITFKEESVESH